ncbi:MAG: RHS repeat-associated core domain-containing protein, partial [Nitrospirae bacterium]|nr:RHS repeat-associated core domain-containing protein [Nitrospirota bacterium]
ALGSVVALTDEAGTIKTQYVYDPYGNTEMIGEPSDNPFQYTGRENDGEGLYYYRARYYSPELQRFISEDPIGLLGGVNLYTYTGNSPVNWIDPLGLKTWVYISVSGGGGFILSGEVGTYYLIDPSTGVYYQFRYGSLGIGLGLGGAVQLEAGTLEGPCDPTEISPWTLTVSGFAAAGKGYSFQATGTSFWGKGEYGGTVGVAGGAGVGVSGMLTHSWYIGKGTVLPKKYQKIYLDLLKTIHR